MKIIKIIHEHAIKLDEKCCNICIFIYISIKNLNYITITPMQYFYINTERNVFIYDNDMLKLLYYIKKQNMNFIQLYTDL